MRIGLYVLFFTLLSLPALAAPLPDVEVLPHNGRPTIFVDGVPRALPAYSPHNHQPLFERQTPVFIEDGAALYTIWIGQTPGDYFGSRFWYGDTIAPGTAYPDPSAIHGLDAQAAYILERDPDALFLIRYYSHPPDTWHALHPQEYAVSETGETLSRPSLASEVVTKAVVDYAAAIVTYVESRSWAAHVIGYSNFYVDEGVHLPVAEGWLYDHNPVMVQRWRAFLKAQYGSDAALRAAWGDSTVSLASVGVPRDPLRGTVTEVTAIRYWQNARANQPMRDYLLLQRDLWHDRFRRVCAASEGAADRKVIFIHDAWKQTMQGWNLYGFFGGTEFQTEGSWSPAYPEFIAGSGNMNLAAAFDYPGFDGLVTPHDYQARGIGGVYEPEGIVDSVILRGKLFLGEMDTRYSSKTGIGAARNMREFAAITRRNLAAGLTRGFTSYYCYMHGTEDWYYEDDVQAEIRRQFDAIRRSLDIPHETVPGIAMILDDSAVLETDGSGNYLNEAVMSEWKEGLARCGVPFRIYLFEDLALDTFPRHRVFYFPDLFRVDDERLSLLKEKVFRDGNVVVWGPGSGISDGVTIDAAHAELLTGFHFNVIGDNAQRRILISRFDHPVTAGLAHDTIIGGPLPYGPVLLPADGLELGLSWMKGGFNYTGLAIKEFGRGAAGSPDGSASRGAGDWASVFTTAVPLPADLWRNLARYAGAHVYLEENDILLADKSIVAIHTLAPGEHRISLPGKYRVTDLITGERIARSADAVTITVTPPETRVFLLE